MRNGLVKLAMTSAIAATTALSGAASAGATPVGAAGAHTAGAVQCIDPGSTFYGGSNLQAGAPVMKAYNYTAGVDRQTVTFQPLVFGWNGSAWVLAASGVTLSGWASDSASPTTWTNTANKTSWGNGTEAFKMPKGIYRVAYKMSWYYSSPVSGNPPTLDGSDYTWASGYSLNSPIGMPLPAITECRA